MDVEEKARKYSRLKYGLIIGETGFFLVFCLLWQFGGLASRLSSAISCMAGPNRYVTGPLFFLIFGLVYYISAFASVFYRTFLLEHQFGLSKETIKGWFADQIKGGIISCVISVVCLDAFYLAWASYPRTWWLLITAGWVALNFLLTFLAPLILIPVFFKCKRIPDDALRGRLVALARDMGIRVLDVYQIDFSRRTTKANAALTGIGATKRVLLSDTMQKTYTDDEIVVIAGHEYAHYRFRHIMKLILFSAAGTAAGAYLLFLGHPAVRAVTGFPDLGDPAAIPVICAYLTLLGFAGQPVLNALSRRFESDADALAIRATGLRGAFISAMEKLAGQNLSDRNPPAIIKWFFFSHPPVDQRIARAR
jgi:STE24 endopeptidase